MRRSSSATSVTGLAHAVVAAGIMTLIVRHDAAIRGPALSVNAAGMSLGVFLGAGAGGAGLAIGDYPGIAGALGALTVLALLISVWVMLRRPRRGANSRIGLREP